MGEGEVRPGGCGERLVGDGDGLGRGDRGIAGFVGHGTREFTGNLAAEESVSQY